MYSPEALDAEFDYQIGRIKLYGDTLTSSQVVSLLTALQQETKETIKQLTESHYRDIAEKTAKIRYDAWKDGAL